jgi:hypothetical protein
MAANQNSIYQRTLDNGGGTFEVSAPNFKRRSISTGYAVGVIDGTFATVPVPTNAKSRKSAHWHFNEAVRNITEYVASGTARANDINAIGTWVNDGVIHIDPVAVIDGRDDAIALARKYNQLAIYNLATGEEVSL